MARKVITSTDDLLLKDRDAMDRDRYGTAVLHFEGRLVEVIFPKHLHGKLFTGRHGQAVSLYKADS
ncbi:MAG: hypothetical protein MZV63_18345 [Marinilabiliales bacterium]|nr:hypothetical protein [Marinilabiliales bacterium]